MYRRRAVILRWAYLGGEGMGFEGNKVSWGWNGVEGQPG